MKPYPVISLKLLIVPERSAMVSIWNGNGEKSLWLDELNGGEVELRGAEVADIDVASSDGQAPFSH